MLLLLRQMLQMEQDKLQQDIIHQMDLEQEVAEELVLLVVMEAKEF